MLRNNRDSVTQPPISLACSVIGSESHQLKKQDQL